MQTQDDINKSSKKVSCIDIINQYLEQTDLVDTCSVYSPALFLSPHIPHTFATLFLVWLFSEPNHERRFERPHERHVVSTMF